jgi:hypothetical protein
MGLGNDPCCTQVKKATGVEWEVSSTPSGELSSPSRSATVSQPLAAWRSLIHDQLGNRLLNEFATYRESAD